MAPDGPGGRGLRAIWGSESDALGYRLERNEGRPWEPGDGWPGSGPLFADMCAENMPDRR